MCCNQRGAIHVMQSMQRKATQANANQCTAWESNAKQCKSMQRNATRCNAKKPADSPTCRPAKVQPGPGQNVTGIKIAIGFSNHRGRRRQGVPRMARRRFLDASDALWWRWCRDAPVATRAQARNSCQSRVVQEPATSTPENDASI